MAYVLQAHRQKIHLQIYIKTLIYKPVGIKKMRFSLEERYDKRK